MSAQFEYIFPVIKGTQASRDYYVSTCPLRLIPKIFLFDEEELGPKLRAQRKLNRNRVPEIARYILENRKSYALSAITASVDGDVSFEAVGSQNGNNGLGLLHIPMSARLVVNDGQHRRAAIETAIRQNPELADESVAIVLLLDPGLKRCAQLFADLNRNVARTSPSASVLYDHRDKMARLTKLVVAQSPIFQELVEMERSTLSLRSRKLFTLSALYNANSALFSRADSQSIEDMATIAISFWETVAQQFPEWQRVQQRKMMAGEVREAFIHSHGVTLHALGRVGSVFLAEGESKWKAKLRGLKGIDWSRSNAKLWEGRTLIGGRVCKARTNVILTANAIKNHLRMSLTPEEKEIEDSFWRGRQS